MMVTVDVIVLVVDAVLNGSVGAVMWTEAHWLGFFAVVTVVSRTRGVFFCGWLAPLPQLCRIAADIVGHVGFVVVWRAGGKCNESCRYDIPCILCS